MLETIFGLLLYSAVCVMFYNPQLSGTIAPAPIVPAEQPTDKPEVIAPIAPIVGWEYIEPSPITIRQLKAIASKMHIKNFGKMPKER